MRTFIHALMATAWGAIAGLAHEGHTHEEDAPQSPAPTPAEAANRTAEEWVRLGDARMQTARDTLSHDFTAAGAAYRAALKLSPKHPDATLGMAWVRNSEHDFDAGAEWARKALELNPSSVRAHNLLGDAAMELGEYDAAFDHLQAALDIRTDLSTLSRASHLLWLTGDANRARAMMLRAIDSGGTAAEHVAWCRSELARMHFKSGMMTAAEQQAEAAVELAPKHPRVLAALALIRAAQGSIEEALALYKASVAVNPTHEALDGLVVLHRLEGNEADAANARERVLSFHRHEHGGDHGHSHHHGPGSAELALFMTEQGMDAEKALHEAEHAYEAFPNLKAADALAWCAYRSGDLPLARRMIRRALKWNTEEPGMLFHAGMIESKAGKVSTARRHLAHALSLNPEFDPVDADLARAELERLGSPDS